MKPHQYFLMFSAIVFGYYAINFLIAYLESHYKVVRIEDTKKREQYVKLEDKVFQGHGTLSTDTVFRTEPEQREPITGHRPLTQHTTGSFNTVFGYKAMRNNILIGHEAGYYTKNQ